MRGHVRRSRPIEYFTTLSQWDAVLDFTPAKKYRRRSWMPFVNNTSTRALLRGRVPENSTSMFFKPANS